MCRWPQCVKDVAYLGGAKQSFFLVLRNPYAEGCIFRPILLCLVIVNDNKYSFTCLRVRWFWWYLSFWPDLRWHEISKQTTTSVSNNALADDICEFRVYQSDILAVSSRFTTSNQHRNTITNLVQFKNTLTDKLDIKIVKDHTISLSNLHRYVLLSV